MTFCNNKFSLKYQKHCLKQITINFIVRIKSRIGSSIARKLESLVQITLPCTWSWESRLRSDSGTFLDFQLTASPWKMPLSSSNDFKKPSEKLTVLLLLGVAKFPVAPSSGFEKSYYISLFVLFLSSCHEKVTVALYFGRILIRLGVGDFQVFRLILWLLPSWFTVPSKLPSID